MDVLNALVALSNFVLVPAIAYGSQLALGALGVTLIYGILRFSNFAHGDTLAFGAMIAVLVTWGLQAAGVGFGPLPTALLALPFAILGCYCAGADHRPAGLSLLPPTKGQTGHSGDRFDGRDVHHERPCSLYHRAG